MPHPVTQSLGILALITSKEPQRQVISRISEPSTVGNRKTYIYHKNHPNVGKFTIYHKNPWISSINSSVLFFQKTLPVLQEAQGFDPMSLGFSFCWPTMFPCFPVVLPNLKKIRLRIELCSMRSRIFFKGGMAGKPSWSTHEDNVFCLSEKRKLANLMKSMYAVLIRLYLQYTYMCWYPVVGLFVINVGKIFHMDLMHLEFKTIRMTRKHVQRLISFYERSWNGVHKPTPGTPNNQFKMDVWWNNRFLMQQFGVILLKQPLKKWLFRVPGLSWSCWWMRCNNLPHVSHMPGSCSHSGIAHISSSCAFRVAKSVQRTCEGYREIHAGQKTQK